MRAIFTDVVDIWPFLLYSSGSGQNVEWNRISQLDILHTYMPVNRTHSFHLLRQGT